LQLFRFTARQQARLCTSASASRWQHILKGWTPGFADVQRQRERRGWIAAQSRDRRLGLPLPAPGGLVINVKIHRIVLRRILLEAMMAWVLTKSRLPQQEGNFGACRDSADSFLTRIGSNQG